MKFRRWILVSAVAGVAIGCAGASSRPAAIETLDRELGGPVAREVQRDAPAAYAEIARAAAAATDAARSAPDTVADRVADAEALLAWGATQARGARARARSADAARRREASESEANRLEQQAAAIDHEVDQRVAAERDLARARAASAAPGGIARGERAQTAAVVLQEAELAIAAAALLGADAASRDRVTRLVHDADTALQHSADPGAALAAAGRAFEEADALVRATRQGHPIPSGATDGAQLVSELSQAGGLDPRRDERGVIAVMRGLFGAGSAIAPAARGRIETMARVIQGHGDARVRVEAYVGGPDRARAERTASTQAQNVVAALVHAGVPQARLAPAGLYRLPAGPRSLDQVEIVLVLPTEP